MGERIQLPIEMSFRPIASLILRCEIMHASTPHDSTGSTISSFLSAQGYSGEVVMEFPEDMASDATMM